MRVIIFLRSGFPLRRLINHKSLTVVSLASEPEFVKKTFPLLKGEISISLSASCTAGSEILPKKE